MATKPKWKTAGDTRGCPHCTHTSAPGRVLTEMKLFDSTGRERIKGKEIDIYIPELEVGSNMTAAISTRIERLKTPQKLNF